MVQTLSYLLGLMDSRGTWTLANDTSGPFRGLPCCWNEAGWKRGLPEPGVQLLGKGMAGATGAATGNPAVAIKGAEVTVAGKVTPRWKTNGADFTWAEVLGGRQK